MLPLSAMMTSPSILFDFKNDTALAVHVPTVRSSFKQGHMMLNSICEVSLAGSFSLLRVIDYNHLEELLN